MLADEREQAVLPLRPLAARLGEAGRDDDERTHAGRERFLRRVEHLLSRHADDGEVDRLRDLPHRAVAVDAGDGVALPVHRVHRAGEVAGEDVAEQLAADRAAAPRRADDRDRPRPEERLERGPHGDVVALGHVLAIRVGRRDREPDLELAALAGARDREACVTEDAEHRVVVVQHLGHELLDPGPGRPGRELLEQARADPAPLELVADGERDLGGARVAQPDPVRDGHDAAVERPEQRAALLPVRLEHRLDELRSERGEAVEAEVAAVLRQVGEELEQRVGILRGGRSQPERRAVAEDDVGRVDLDGRRAHAAAACSPRRQRGRTTSTGHGAEWTSPVETLPERKRRAAPQPCEPTTISCASCSPAIAADLLDRRTRRRATVEHRTSVCVGGLRDRRQELCDAIVLGLGELGDDVRRSRRRRSRLAGSAACATETTSSGASSRSASSNASFCASTAEGEPSVANRIGLRSLISASCPFMSRRWGSHRADVRAGRMRGGARTSTPSRGRSYAVTGTSCCSSSSWPTGSRPRARP